MLQVDSFKKTYGDLKHFLAKHYRKIYSQTGAEFIAVIDPASPKITGRAIYQILSEKYPTIASNPSTDGPQPASLASTILKLSPKIKKVILDLSDEDHLKLDSSITLINPTTLLITRILEPSLVQSLAGLIESSLGDKTLILNWDDAYCRRLGDQGGEVVYFGSDPNNCHVWAGNINVVNFQTSFELNYGVERVEITTPLLGNFQIEPLLAAATVGIRAGVSLINLKKGLEEIEVSDSQLQPFKGFSDSIVLDSSSSSHPLIIEAAIDILNQLPARRRMIVIGEIGPTGELPASSYQQIAQKIYKDRVDLVFTTGGDATIVGEELINLGFIPERLQTKLQIQQIVAQLLKILAKGDVVLLCGSKAVRLDEVVKKITKK